MEMGWMKSSWSLKDIVKEVTGNSIDFYQLSDKEDKDSAAYSDSTNINHSENTEITKMVTEQDITMHLQYLIDHLDLLNNNTLLCLEGIIKRELKERTDA
ncbi:MAG: hypothetical protein M1481_03790 [Candidatus Thermoplasmatota archaeon]|nr:hypothetical protein [Candidatus Thermoplasmatota archaeon]MCL5963365.1 hypothetical protein [Candidatus Thermoplasmatota archaeon]